MALVIRKTERRFTLSTFRAAAMCQPVAAKQPQSTIQRTWSQSSISSCSTGANVAIPALFTARNTIHLYTRQSFLHTENVDATEVLDCLIHLYPRHISSGCASVRASLYAVCVAGSSHHPPARDSQSRNHAASVPLNLPRVLFEFGQRYCSKYSRSDAAQRQPCMTDGGVPVGRLPLRNSVRRHARFLVFDQNSTTDGRRGPDDAPVMIATRPCRRGAAVL